MLKRPLRAHIIIARTAFKKDETDHCLLYRYLFGLGRSRGVLFFPFFFFTDEREKRIHNKVILHI